MSTIKQSALSRYEGHADTFLAYLDGKPACGHILLRDTEIGRARLLYSASRRFDDRETARLCDMLIVSAIGTKYVPIEKKDAFWKTRPTGLHS